MVGSSGRLQAIEDFKKDCEMHPYTKDDSNNEYSSRGGNMRTTLK